MNTAWKWIVGILLGLVILGGLAMPLLARFFYPGGGYGMMGYGWGMPMMYGGYPMMGFGYVFSGLIQLGLLILVVLAIVWLWGEIKKQGTKHD